MEPFARLDAAAVPIGVPNIDTDQVIPARFLWRKRHDGWGHLLFHDLRFNDSGTPKPEFVLNRDAYRDARILVADRNFGCGSSREHAAWALSDFGIRCVIASSFADIFHSNAGKNGILLITLPEEQVQALMTRASSIPRYQLTVSLEDEMLHDDHGLSLPFSIDPFRRECLLLGLDDIGLSLKHGGALEKFEQRHDREFWYAPRPADTLAQAKEQGAL